MVVMGACGRSLILLAGPVDVSGHLLSTVDLGGGSLWPIIDGGGCEERMVVTCDIAFVTSHAFTQSEFEWMRQMKIKNEEKNGLSPKNDHDGCFSQKSQFCSHFWSHFFLKNGMKNARGWQDMDPEPRVEGGVRMPTLWTATPNFSGGLPWMTMHLKLTVQTSKPSTTLYIDTPYTLQAPSWAAQHAFSSHESPHNLFFHHAITILATITTTQARVCPSPNVVRHWSGFRVAAAMLVFLTQLRNTLSFCTYLTTYIFEWEPLSHFVFVLFP